ncbi:MAG: dihydropyrimidinase [Anaerolineae bacterium]|nr:dihydropyrimidinase [Anaerolineae bacterium]
MRASDTLLLRGGTVVTPEGMLECDVLVRGEKIQALGQGLTAPGEAEVVDIANLLVLPGVIDAHTHIQLDTGIYKTPDDWYVESRAAALGGVTTVVDFATQFKGQTFEDALTVRLQEAMPSVIDYTFHMMVTDVPPGEEDVLGELVDLGIPSIKLYTTYRPNYYADDATLLRLLEAAGRYGLTTLVHCENDALVTAQTQTLVEAGQTGWRYHGTARPALAELEATSRVLFLAHAAGAPVVIAHNSLSGTTMLVAEARARGQMAFCETAPQYLLLDNTLYGGGGTGTPTEPWRYILQPPLRDAVEKEKLWRLVSRGYVDMMITDHCAYAREQKMAMDDFTKTPGGLPGLETLLPLVATYGVAEGRIGWPDVARLLAMNPARIYNLWPRKGALLPGADADMVLYDPTVENIISTDTVLSGLHSTAGYTPFEGMWVRGKVMGTLRRGSFLVRDGEFVGETGTAGYTPGTFIHRDARQDS